MHAQDLQQFANLSYEDFRRRAGDKSLSEHEKVGFPDSYREGFEEAIFEDIVRKLPPLSERDRTVLDIGPGCAGLPRMLQRLCRAQGHSLILVDSAEMLAHLPDEDFVLKVPGYFPDIPSLIDEYGGAVHAILAYSVLQYVFAEASVWEFLDRSLELLAEGGIVLIGDIPNASKRKRFFESAEGVAFHRKFTGSDELPRVEMGAVDPGQIDDTVVVGLLMHARTAGCDAYVVPQAESLPMANRREDIVIRKP